MEIKFTTGAGKIETITIPDDMVFRGYLNLSDMGLTELPDLSAVTVTGDFICSGNQLTSLQGAPQSVGKCFICRRNKLTSLQGAPQSVGKSFDCSENQLTSLQGAPQSVGGCFDCHENQLTSLQGAPQSVGWFFDCRKNQLTSVVGAPQKIVTDFICDKESLKAEYEKIQLAARVAAKQKEISAELARWAKQRKK